MVNWKDIPKIDAHIHLLPEDVIRENIGCGDRFVEFGSIRDFLRIMKENNIVCAFVMPFNDPCMLSMDFSVNTVNSNLRQFAAFAPGKLFCFADVDIRNSIDQTINQLEEICTKAEFLGIKLHPTNVGYPIDGEYYDCIFRYANDNGITVEIHSYPRESLSDDVCSPRRIKNVLHKFPKLKVSVAHLGGFQYEELYGLDAYFNMSSILPDLVNRLGLEEANRVLRSIGVSRLVFATDYPDSRCLHPADIYEAYYKILSQMDFTYEEAEQICKFNAMRMVGLQK